MIQIHFLGYENKLGAWIDLIQYAINMFWAVGKFYQQIWVNGATLLQNGQRWETFKKKNQEHISVLIKGLDHQKEYSKLTTRAKSNGHVIITKLARSTDLGKSSTSNIYAWCGFWFLSIWNVLTTDYSPQFQFSFGGRHLAIPIWSHFFLNVHYMPAYVAQENITLWILHSWNKMQVQLPQATTVTIFFFFKKQACTNKSVPPDLLSCWFAKGQHFLISNRQKTNF